MTDIRLIIAGGRDFNNLELMKKELGLFLPDAIGSDITVISGEARGADIMGRRLAESLGLKVELYPANWDRDGRSAGYIRNSLMANTATHLLAFWDRRSKGTEHMIKLGNKMGLTVCVVHYAPGKT